MTLYEELKETGVEVKSHMADLCFRETIESRKILLSHEAESKQALYFHDHKDGSLWIKVPWAFDPHFGESKMETLKNLPGHTLALLENGALIVLSGGKSPFKDYSGKPKIPVCLVGKWSGRLEDLSVEFYPVPSDHQHLPADTPIQRVSVVKADS